MIPYISTTISDGINDLIYEENNCPKPIMNDGSIYSVFIVADTFGNRGPYIVKHDMSSGQILWHKRYDGFNSPKQDLPVYSYINENREFEVLGCSRYGDIQYGIPFLEYQDSSVLSLKKLDLDNGNENVNYIANKSDIKTARLFLKYLPIDLTMKIFRSENKNEFIQTKRLATYAKDRIIWYKLNDKGERITEIDTIVLSSHNEAWYHSLVEYKDGFLYLDQGYLSNVWNIRHFDKEFNLIKEIPLEGQFPIKRSASIIDLSDNYFTLKADYYDKDDTYLNSVYTFNYEGKMLDSIAIPVQFTNYYKTIFLEDINKTFLISQYYLWPEFDNKIRIGLSNSKGGIDIINEISLSNTRKIIAPYFIKRIENDLVIFCKEGLSFGIINGMNVEPDFNARANTIMRISLEELGVDLSSATYTEKDNKLIISPIPVESEISIKDHDHKVEIFNMQGIKLITSNKDKIDVKNLANGIYLAKSNGKVARFVKI